MSTEEKQILNRINETLEILEVRTKNNGNGWVKSLVITLIPFAIVAFWAMTTLHFTVESLKKNVAKHEDIESVTEKQNDNIDRLNHNFNQIEKKGKEHYELIKIKPL